MALENKLRQVPRLSHQLWYSSLTVVLHSSLARVSKLTVHRAQLF